MKPGTLDSIARDVSIGGLICRALDATALEADLGSVDHAATADGCACGADACPSSS